MRTGGPSASAPKAWSRGRRRCWPARWARRGLIGDDHVRRLRTSRRTELAGEPLVWQVAIENLVAELVGR
jgi:hypothetical protein